MDELDLEERMEGEDRTMRPSLSGLDASEVLARATGGKSLSVSITDATDPDDPPEPRDDLLPEWWDDHNNLAALGTFLVSHEDWSHEDVWQIVEKPWHFEAEWARLQTYREVEAAVAADIAEMSKPIEFEDQDFDE